MPLEHITWISCKYLYVYKEKEERTRKIDLKKQKVLGRNCEVIGDKENRISYLFSVILGGKDSVSASLSRSEACSSTT